ncbi:hypothetical protein H0O00_03245 [Candidatus Micrarchaeota archaeon]|nr:hypothetical protein [Candidatus Micrarchaeota archaeon]
METASAKCKPSPPGLVLVMANRFSRYRPETEKAVRKVEVVEDETLRQLKEAWKTCSYTGDSNGDYPEMLKIVKKLRYSAKDVENFSVALAEFRDEKGFSDSAGLFLSALINSGTDSDYVIHTNHWGVPVTIGEYNTKNITVNGDAGNHLGFAMNGGSIIVNGNARWHPGGLMRGGSIIVNGDAGWYVGLNMRGGSITMNGDAGKGAGAGMRGGEIHIEGSIEEIATDIKHGKIYHKGKLIVDK